MGWLIAFAAGFYFGRNPGATQAVIVQGQQLLDTVTGQPVARTVLPNTTIVAPPTGGCPPGQFRWEGGVMGTQCIDQKTYEALMSGGLVQAGSIAP
jgi:hypothetical protein